MAANFKPGSVVWAKCGSLFWPAEVVDFDALPGDVKEDFTDKTKPMFVVKFFDEDGYEFLKNDKNIFAYNCDKKEEFIKKGIVKSRSKSKEGATSGWFAKFPNDVIRSEKLTGGDIKILEKEPYIEKNERINYKEIFGDPNENKAKRKSTSSAKSSPTKKAKPEAKSEPRRPISHPRFKPGGEQHQVRIMQQPSTPYHLDLQKKEESKAASSQGNYTCQTCGFSASRLNVFILHSKTHSEPQKGASSSSRSSTPAKAGRNVSTPSTGSASTPTGRGRGRGKKTPASTVSSPVKSKAAPSSPASTPKGRGRGRPSKSKQVAPSASPEVPAEATSKKPRMTKKKKDQLAAEQEKKLAERKKILGEWDEEEDGEAEAAEKKKIKENLGEGESDHSEAESDQEAYFQDDNIQGNTYMDEDDEEEFFEDEKDKAKKDAAIVKEKAKEEEAKEDKKSETSKPDIDIAKILEETKVPELPEDLGNIEAVIRSKKSVKFSPQVAKEIAITKLALVQPSSNMAGPMDVEDEFLEDEAPAENLRPVSKTILKKLPSRSPPLPPPEAPSSTEPEEVTSTASEDMEVTSTEASEVVSSSAEAPVTSTSTEDKSTSEAAANLLALGQTPALAAEAGKEAAANNETYLLVVDEANQLDQLNSQTFYIDSNSLANGDLSNMVLTTGPPAASEAASSNGHQAEEPQMAEVAHS